MPSAARNVSLRLTAQLQVAVSLAACILQKWAWLNQLFASCACVAFAVWRAKCEAATTSRHLPAFSRLRRCFVEATACCKMSVCLALFSPGRFPAPPASEEGGEYLPEEALPPPLSFSRHRTPSHRSFLLPPLFRSPTLTRSRLRLFPSPPFAERRAFDLLSRLPPEISVKILACLHPSDLCRFVHARGGGEVVLSFPPSRPLRVCQVCRRWLALAQYPQLRRQRRRYLKARREEFIANRVSCCGFSRLLACVCTCRSTLVSPLCRRTL